MRIAIIEDEQVHKELLSSYLQSWSRDGSVSIVIDTFPSAESFLFEWAEKKDYDVLFVDIQMREMNGMEMARAVRQDGSDVAIVFTTGITDYLEEGYEVEALHYLIKPIDEAKVRKCMDKVVSRNKQETYLILNHDGELKKVNEDSITYIEARGHGAVIEVMTGGNADKIQVLEVTDSLSELEKQLDMAKFVKCHRSYICNVERIHHIDKTSVYLDSGSSVPVSRRMYAEVNQAFIRHFKKM